MPTKLPTSIKLLWTGFTFIVALDKIFIGLPMAFIGYFVMAFGAVMLWLDR